LVECWQQAGSSQQDEPSQQVFAPKALAVKTNIIERPSRAEMILFIVFSKLK